MMNIEKYKNSLDINNRIRCEIKGCKNEAEYELDDGSLICEKCFKALIDKEGCPIKPEDVESFKVPGDYENITPEEIWETYDTYEKAKLLGFPYELIA